MMQNALRFGLAISVSALALAAKPVLAQEDRAEAADDGVEEIFVTATRQEESLSKVPLSIAAFSQEMLDQKGVRKVDDIASLTPGVTFTRGDQRNAGAANISIRGVSSTAGSATTGIYIDDTPIQVRTIGFSAYSPFPAIFDLGRVEVLRGPQGTLFGAGAEGGAVRFITPSIDYNSLRAYARSEIASTRSGDTSYEAGLAVGIPLVADKLALRVSAYTRHDGGFVDRVDYLSGNVEDANANWQNTTVLQAKLGWRPTETITITPSIYYQDLYSNDSLTYWVPLSNPDKDDYRNGNALSQWSKDKFALPALNVEIDLGDVMVVSNSSYFWRDQKARNDYTVFESALWTGSPYFPQGMYAPTMQYNTQDNFTQEVRVQSNNPDSALKWVFGGFYSHSKQTARQFVQDTFLPDLFFARNGVPFEVAFGQGLADGLYTFVLDKAVSVDKQIAGFAQVDWTIAEKLTLTAGVRVAQADFEASAQFKGPVVGPPVDDVGSQSETPITPKFGISYQADDDNMIYASAAKGFRIGGYNPAVGLPCGVSQTDTPIPGTPLGNLGLANRPPLFGSDSVWSYEVGTKNKLFDRRLQLDVSAFYIDWSNIQQQVSLACGFQFVDNLGSATSKGFDVQFQLRPVDALTIGGSVGYTKAEFNETVSAGPSAPLNLVTKGDDIILNPWQIYLNGQYDFEVAGRDAFVRVDFQFQSEQTAIIARNNPENGGTDLTIPNRPQVTQTAVRAGVNLGDADISVFVNNVFNENPVLVRTRDTGFSPLYKDSTLRPRTFGITASYRY